MESTPQNLWQTKYATGCMEDGNMAIHYHFPFSRHREAALLGCYNLAPKDRFPYYKALSAMVERNLHFAEYLAQNKTASILTFENTYQKATENGVICVCCIPSEPVTPITQSLFRADCNAMTALDVFLRLAHILRDIHNLPDSIALRYLDLDDVYLTASNKILLGGFYYATCKEMPDFQPFLPDAAKIIPNQVITGQRADAGTDMQTLAQIAWNIFSGLPWNCGHTEESRRIPPMYAPPALLQVLELGLAGDPGQLNAFRKALFQAKKNLAGTEFASATIPISNPFQKEFHFAVDIPAKSPEIK